MKVNSSPSLKEVAFIYISWAVGRIRPLFLEEIMGLSRVLHTDSSNFSGSYLKGSEERASYNKETNITASFNAAYDYALEQELRFYNQFFSGITSFEGFMAKLRELFNGASQDGKRIAQLGNLNLASLLDSENTILSQKLTYEIIVEKDAVKLPLSDLNSANVTYIGGDMYLNVDGSITDAKFLATKIRNSPDIKKLTKTNPGTFTKNSSAVALKQWFHDELEETLVEAGQAIIKEFGTTGVKLKISNNNEATTSESLKEPIQIAVDYPLMTEKPSNIMARLNDPSTRNETMASLKRIYGRFYKFLVKLLNNGSCVIEGRDILYEAFQRAWKKNAGTIESFIGSLLVGNNLSAGLKGVLGEFQADIIFEYMQIACEATNPKLGRIIGGIGGGKRGQPRADYQIIIELGGGDQIGQLVAGIQVKNYSDSMMSHIEINTDLGLIAPNIGSGFTDTVVNAQFNKDIASMAGTGTGTIDKFLKRYLETYFWQGMNLNIGDKLDPDNTNTFYLVQGTMIVPASTIINTIRNKVKISNPKFSITGFQKPSMGDADFLAGDPPEFVKYWRDNQYIEGSATELNRSSYEGFLIDTKIHTSFNMSAILGANGAENFRFF